MFYIFTFTRMRKKILKLSLLVAICAASAVFTLCKNDEVKPETPEGVVINGITWATRNVGKFGTFAENPQSSGMLYQWGRPKAWFDSTIFVTDWDTTISEDSIWKKENDPSPEGWRVPTVEELERLFDVRKVKGEWCRQNGVNGYKFTDNTTKVSIFLPAVGYRDTEGRLRGVDASCLYWSATLIENKDKAFYMELGENDASLYGYYARNQGFSIRCVRAE